VSRQGERFHLRPLAHPTLLALTHHCLLDQSSYPTRVHFGPLSSAAKMGSYNGVVPWLHCTRRQVGSKYSSEPSSPTFHVSSFSSTSLAICCRPQLFHPPVFFFESYASFPSFARPGAVPVILSLLPFLFRSSLSWADGSKTHRRGV
jgi:hypothetical protein